MKTYKSSFLRSRFVRLTVGNCFLSALVLLTSSTYAATLSWSGGSPSTGNWSDIQNWGFAGTPATGDILIFPGAQPRLANVNDIASLTVSEIRFVGTSGGYTISGNALTVTNGITATNTAGVNAIANNIALASVGLINVGSGASLTLSGGVSGSVGVTKSGLGTLTYSGGANTYSGITIALEGTLELNKPGDVAIPNTLQVGDPTHSATVRWLSGNQIPNTSTVTVFGGSVLDVNNLLDDLGTLNLYASTTVNMGTGFLDFRSPHSINVLSGTATINGRIGLPSGDITVDVPLNTTLQVNATITGGSGFNKSGVGMMYLNAANTYSGLTVVQAGWLRLQNGSALGSSASGTVVSNLASLVFDGAFGVTNESLTLNGFGVGSGWGALDSEAGGNAFWTGPITLNADSTIAPFAGGSVLHLTGVISGPGGLIVGTQTGSGSGSLYFDGASANTYAGDTSVRAGTLFLNKGVFDGSIPHNLIIGNGSGADTVRLLQQNQIPNTALVTINLSGVLDLNNLIEGVDALDMTGGTVQSGTGTLVLFGNSITTHASAAVSTISGTLNLAGGTTTVDVANGGASTDLLVSAAVQGSGIIKNGSGNLQFSAANSYGGPTTINNGFIIINDPAGLGTAAAGTVLNGGNLSLVGATVSAEPLTNNSVNSILQASGTSGWGTNVVLNANLEVQVLGAGNFDISGTVSGVGGIKKSVTGTLRFSGGVANTYAGTTTVEAGTLELSKSSGVISIPGNLVIGDGVGGANADVVRYLNYNQIANTTDVLINSSGLLDFGVYYDTFDELAGSGNIIFGALGYVDIGANNGSSTWNGVASGPGFAGGYTMRKLGTGTVTFNGDNTFLNQTRVDNGAIIINGDQPQSPLLVNGGTAGGTGTVGDIRCLANLSPGASPGMLTCSNLSFTSAGDYFVDLTGPTAGTGYDQLNVRGTNNLSGAVLHLTTAFTIPVAVGQQFNILNNDGVDAITGTFNGLAEGASITAGFYSFTISYTGGNGNDVVLTLTNVPGASVNSLAGITLGNGNGNIDPNECNYLSVVITNKTATPMTGVSAVLSSITSGVTVTDPLAGYPDVAGNGQGTNSSPFQISTTPSFVCGTDVNLLLSVTTASHGAFSVPVTLHSGSPAFLPVRYDNNTVTNITDIGTVESTNTVSSWPGGPVAKIGVSLWLVAPFTSDMTLSLVAPNGDSVELSSGNGAAANFGTGSADASRTTFDDAAAVSITAGVSPFVGTFRPEGSLASLLSANPIGNWRLRIQDSFGSGSPDTLRAWSLFLYPTECATGSGLCELCPNVVLTSAMGPASPVSPGYVNPVGVPSVCGVAKACPGTAGGSYRSEVYRFRNGPSNACITVALENQNAGFGMVVAAYADGFDPANPDKCANYLADAGTVAGPDYGSATRSFSFDVAANAAFVVHVVSGGFGSYKLTVTGGDCRPALNITDVGAGKALLDWTTAAPGYQLESTNSLSVTGPVWQPAGSAPVVVNSRFTATNNISGTNQFFRLRKQVP